jgi:hypothetical protein
MSEDSISDSSEGVKLRSLIDEVRAQSPSRILPLKVIAHDSDYSLLEPFLGKLVQEKSESPGLNVSYYEFYNSHLKGISKFF